MNRPDLIKALNKVILDNKDRQAMIMDLILIIQKLQEAEEEHQENLSKCFHVTLDGDLAKVMGASILGREGSKDPLDLDYD